MGAKDTLLVIDHRCTSESSTNEQILPADYGRGWPLCRPLGKTYTDQPTLGVPVAPRVRWVWPQHRADARGAGLSPDGV